MRPLPDLAARTEAALASALAQAAGRATQGVPEAADSDSDDSDSDDEAVLPAAAPARRPLTAPEPTHRWQLRAWHGEAAAQPSVFFPSSHANRRLLFALRPAELAADEAAALRDGRAFALPARASNRLAALQFRLEAYRPGCRPAGLRASGEAPPGWLGEAGCR